MTTLTIADLDAATEAALRARAAAHGVSLEDEARAILRAAAARAPARGLGTFIHEAFGPLGGLEPDLSMRVPVRDAPLFDWIAEEDDVEGAAAQDTAAQDTAAQDTAAEDAPGQGKS